VDGDEGGGAGVHGRHFFKDQRGVEPGQGEATGGFGRIQAAKAQLARLGDGFFGEDAFGVPLRGVGASSAWAKSRAVWAKARCSSVSSKSMAFCLVVLVVLVA
jgi:hypothetical protein